MESPESHPSVRSHENPVYHPPEETNGAKSSPSLVPPYWSHRRYESYSSVKNTRPPPITLEDHTEESCEQSGPVWATGVTIDDHVLVSGTVPTVGSFVVWNCKIETIDVSWTYFVRWTFLVPGLWFAVPYGLLANGVKGGSIVIRKRSILV